jgi:hypothetical protein
LVGWRRDVFVGEASCGKWDENLRDDRGRTDDYRRGTRYPQRWRECRHQSHGADADGDRAELAAFDEVAERHQSEQPHHISDRVRVTSNTVDPAGTRPR